MPKAITCVGLNISLSDQGCGVANLSGFAARSVNCAALEKARARISKVATSPAIPDAAKNHGDDDELKDARMKIC